MGKAAKRKTLAQPTPAKKAKGSQDTPEKLAQNIMKAGGWKGAIMDELEHVLEKSSVHEYIDERLGTQEKLSSWVAQFEEKMPPTKKSNYCVLNEGQDAETKNTILRPWMFAWRPSVGQSGIMVKEDVQNLVSLILLQGFRTDAAMEAGAEKVVAYRTSAELVPDYESLPTARVKGYSFAAGSVGEVPWSSKSSSCHTKDSKSSDGPFSCH